MGRSTHNRIPGVGQYHMAARRAVVVPLLGAITIATGAVVLGPWPFHDRLALLVCLLGGCGCILAEWTVPWERVSQNVYLLLPAAGVLIIGVAMWPSGGWSSPFAPDILLPVIFAAIVAGSRRTLPLAALAGLVQASPGLYDHRGNGVLVAVGAVVAYCVISSMVGTVVDYMRGSERSAVAESEARAQTELFAANLMAIQQVSSIVAQHLSMDDAIEAIATELHRAFEHWSIQIYLREGHLLTLQAHRGAAAPDAVVPLGSGAIGRAADHGVTVVSVHPPASDHLALPLKDGGVVVGVLSVESVTPFVGFDRDLLELFATQASVVFGNARHAGELRDQADQDALTGLLNRRALETALERTLIDSSAGCAVLMIDVNNFKYFNDTFGHLAGDSVLLQVASVLRDDARDTDLAARYGGDEFVVILPNTPLPVADAAAARIADALAADPFETMAGLRIPLSLAIGVAVAPDDGTSGRELLEHADAAMYGTKLRMTRGMTA